MRRSVTTAPRSTRSQPIRRRRASTTPLSRWSGPAARSTGSPTCSSCWPAPTRPTPSRRSSAKSRRCSRATTTRSIWTARFMPASPSFTGGAAASAFRPSKRACSTATTPVSCARAARWRSRRRTGSRRSTSGWRASAPSSGRTCWRTRKPTRSFWRRAISPACPTSRAPPRARRPRNAATPANTPSRFRARPARHSCNFRRDAICARKSSRPGSSAAKTVARPTTARSSPRWCACARSAPISWASTRSPTTGSTTRWPRRRPRRASCSTKSGAVRAPRRRSSAMPCKR